MPRKHLFWSQTSAVISEREAGLTEMVQAMGRDPSVAGSAQVQTFLGLEGWLAEEELPVGAAGTATTVEALARPHIYHTGHDRCRF